MMRCAWALLVLAGCGRIRFDERTATTDGNRDTTMPASSFSRLVAYGNATCAQYDGRPYCWGDNTSGQAGDPTKADHTAPNEVAVPEGQLRALSIGERHACAVIDTKLVCWGLLNGTVMGATVIDAPPPVTDVAVGKDFACAVANSGVVCWGVNDAGQLGDGTLAPRQTPTPINSQALFVAVDVGDDHGCALTTTNDALCWGHNDSGALGFGAFNPANQMSPQLVVGEVATLPRIAGWHACTAQGGIALCWGRNDEGALGDNTTTSQATPQPVPGFDGVTAIATGGGPDDLDATCAIRSGLLYCWGAGTGGRLGNGTTANELVPRQVVLAGTPVEIALGYAHSCALLADGDIYCWGRGSAGQLGNGTKTDSFTPVRVMRPATGS